ncbi:MAG: Holliday junction resolvase RuvX [Fimbriimonadaceae bacterium]|nr:Holliday junction resolvase RuvX [Fimbriimonadaceae bacterium]
MRVLGIDFGSKRIGIAIGESDHQVATARKPIEASGTLRKDAEAISQLARTEQVDRLILGIPLNPDGEDRMARVCGKLGEILRELGWTVETVDESFTSVLAESDLAELGLKASERRKQRDGEAAVRILERYWHGEKETQQT